MAEQHETPDAAAAFDQADKANWIARLVRNDRGGLLPVLDNIVAILLNDERWAGVIAFDQMSGRVMKLKVPPFDQGELGEWIDIDFPRLEHWLGPVYGMRKITGDMLLKGVMLAADKNRYHEVRDYLEPLAWDGMPRARELFWAYFGAGKSDYAELVAVKWLVSAIARVYRAPVKADLVLILEGPQGAGKSSALKTLFSPWFTDAAFELGTPDGYQIIRGMWGVELAELDGFRSAESSKAKAFFTREQDRYRPPYGRTPVNVARQCVFAGTVNHGTYLKDDSGNRRYLPIKTGYIGLDNLAQDRDQIWAEALHLYRDGLEWWVRASERDMFEEEQEARYLGDAWETRARKWLNTTDAGGSLPNVVNSATLLQYAIGLEVGKWTPTEQQRVGRIMTRIGWPREREKKSRPGASQREWFYVRPSHLEQWRREQDADA